jgi:GT2 family glycosyltransferase
MTASSSAISDPRPGNTASAPFVSVVIPTFNRSGMLCDCVDAILANTYRDFEIIIVDNASEDDTEEVVRKRYLATLSNVRYHRNPANLMVCGGRNAGIRLARGQWILCLDSDNIALPDMLAELVACAERHPELGLIGTLNWNVWNQSIRTLGGDINWWTGRAADHHLELYLGKRIPFEEIDRIGLEESYPTYASCPDALFIKRTTVEKVGDFNPYYGIYFDDPSYCLRVTRAGIAAAICTRARTRHMCFAEGGEPSPLRRLGIGNTRSAFRMARNRSWFMKEFSPWWGKITYFLFFVHALCLYYVLLTLRHGHPECTWAFFKGTWVGIFSSSPPYPPPGWHPGAPNGVSDT